MRDLRPTYRRSVESSANLDEMCRFLIIFKIFANLFFFVSCYRILGIPSLGTSHAKVLAKIGEKLSSRGHTFILVVASWEAKRFNKQQNLVLYTYETPFKSSDLEAVMQNEVEGRFTVTQNINLWKISCKFLLESVDLKQLRKIDLILSDIGWLCPPIFADMVKVPRVDISPGGFVDPFISYVHNLPNSVAYIPQMSTKFPKKSSLLFRALNLLLYAIGVANFKFVLLPEFEKLWQQYAARQSYFTDIDTVFKNRGLLIIPVDFVIDYPRTLAPHVKVTGPILPAPPEALPKGIEDFIFHQDERSEKTQKKKVILVSLGTVISKFKPEFVKLIASALASIDAKFIWKHKGSDSAHFGENIMTIDWMPQNDLLGHPLVKAFITHGGLNSIYESCYHGVPMVVIPLFADQPGNAVKVQENGAGIMLDLNTLNSFVLAQAINRVLNERKFKENTLRISKIIQSRNPVPNVEAANWVEYMLQTNATLHLRSEADNLYFFEIYLVDVIALFFLLVVFGVVFFTKFCGIFFYKYYKKKKQKRE